MTWTLSPHQPYLAPSRRWDGLTVGLYGGSFNPAHQGHIHVSARALKRLKLDALWWLVTPLNPLKDAAEMASLAARMQRARSLVEHPKIHVTAIEQDLGTRFSVETIARLLGLHRRTTFVWVMGADSLATFHRWRGWQDIFRSIPLAVVDRPGYSLQALASPAARRFSQYRVPDVAARRLGYRTPPAWVFLRGPLHPASATAIRARRPNWGKQDWSAHD